MSVIQRCSFTSSRQTMAPTSGESIGDPTDSEWRHDKEEDQELQQRCYLFHRSHASVIYALNRSKTPVLDIKTTMMDYGINALYNRVHYATDTVHYCCNREQCYYELVWVGPCVN